MKLYHPPAWTAVILAGGLLTALPAQAYIARAKVTHLTTARVASTVSAAATRLTAVGLANPIGSQVQLSWVPVPRARTYKVCRDGQPVSSTDRNSWIDYGVAGGETHSYTVTSTDLFGESSPSAPASARVPAGGGQVIYADSLENAWQPWGWASMDLSSGSPVRSGRAICVSATPWQALYLHHQPFNSASYAALTFWINGGQKGGQRLFVRALRSGAPQFVVPIGPLPAGQWQSITIPLGDLGVKNVPDLDGLWIQDATGTTQTPFYLDEIALTAAVINLPAAPTGLAATPAWAASCSQCQGMAMAHILLAWNAVPNAASYTIYRGGVKVKDALTTPSWIDMDVVSGQAYTYMVTANGVGGEGPKSALASATALQPPAGQALMTAPVNVSVMGTWQGATTDVLSWAIVPGAAGYNVYQYDVLIAKGLKTTSYTVPAHTFYDGLTYTVTAVDGMGMESLPSAITMAQGSLNPASQPSWVPDAPIVPTEVTATPEWNAGVPRVHVKWRGHMVNYTYNVYRDGQKVASGLWGLNFYDVTVRAGETHTYTVTGVNTPWTSPVESAQSASAAATAPAAAPNLSATAIQIMSVRSNDDSVLVSFAAVPGAVDYRVYNVTNPASAKYSGGGLSVEMNGLDPAKGADLVVEAVDKLGPYQTMDGMAGPGAMQMDGMHVATNGQGDPSNIPNVLAVSAPFHVTCQSVTLAGSQVFFDNFRGEQPLTAQPLPTPAGDQFYGREGDFAEFANDKWIIRDYGGDLVNTKLFFMGNHFMDTLYDGGTPHASNPMHNNNASIVMMPRATGDISGGRVLHVTFEVDAHVNGRRWCDLQIAGVGDILTTPGKVTPGDGRVLPATVSGNSLRWEIQGEFHQLVLFHNDGTQAQPAMRQTMLIDTGWGPNNERGSAAARTRWDGAPLANGTTQDLDKRHKFDMFLSQSHCRIVENGQTIKDMDLLEKLPFDKVQAYFVHQLYHTGNDRPEMVTYAPGEPYWYNNRPWSDERHWDNMGQEVLTAFPALP